MNISDKSKYNQKEQKNREGIWQGAGDTFVYDTWCQLTIKYTYIS